MNIPDIKARTAQFMHAVWQKKGLVSTLLMPLAYLTGRVVKHKEKHYLHNPGWHPGIPVIVVGNIFVGGTGKTPVVISLVEDLKKHGWQPGVVSRGYGAKAGLDPLVGTNPLNPNQFGDEPALIAAATNVPVAVHPDRPKAVQSLLSQHPDINVIVSDDGLQHLQLARDIEIIVQDSRGTGNGRLLPAGPLREPEQRMEQADVIITNILNKTLESATDMHLALRIKPYQANMAMQPSTVRNLSTGVVINWNDWLSELGSQPVAAVAGLGNPQRFFNMLKQYGINLQLERALPDHGTINKNSFNGINATTIVITAKDAIKCQNINDPRIWCIDVLPKFSNIDWLAHILKRISS